MLAYTETHMRYTLSRVRYVVDVDISLVLMIRGSVTMSRVGSGWGVNLGGVSLEALALPPLHLATRPRISRVLKQKCLRLPSVLGRMPLLWVSPCVASALRRTRERVVGGAHAS